jgi:hypothetical protein
MEVEKVLNLNDYWRDSRFACKKPSKNGTLIEQAGDNLYHHHRGQWVQHRDARYHRKPPQERFDPSVKPLPVWMKDVRGNKVFVGKRFVYYGENAVDLPAEIAKFLPNGQGIKYLKAESEDFAAFSIWAFGGNRRKKLGRLGMPRDWKGTVGCGQETTDSAEDKANRVTSTVRCRVRDLSS